MKYTCPCCGYKTLDRKPPGTFQVCKICFWEDDTIQYYDPEYNGGANEISLREAQHNFLKIGASRERFKECAHKPTRGDIKDPQWKLL
jgi:hypothetical protein